jgi:hypothetical protein
MGLRTHADNGDRCPVGAHESGRLLRLVDCYICSTVTFVRLLLLFDSHFYLTVTFVPRLRLFDWFFCSTVTFVRLSLLFDCYFCLTVTFDRMIYQAVIFLLTFFLHTYICMYVPTFSCPHQVARFFSLQHTKMENINTYSQLLLNGFELNQMTLKCTK